MMLGLRSGAQGFGLVGNAVVLTPGVFAVRRLLVHRMGPLENAERKGPYRFGRRTFLLRVRSRRIEIPAWFLGAVALSALVAPVVAVAVAAVLSARAFGARRRWERARMRTWASVVPDLVELVRLALASGCTIHLALLLIAQRAGGSVSEMLDRAAASLREGVSTAEVLSELQARVGSPIRPLCSALLGSERYGLPLTATLEALSVEARLARQRDAELRSRRLPVLLIFPLVVCVLPAFALLTVVPLLGGGLSSLSW